MRVPVIGGDGETYTIIMAGADETVIDRSGTFAAPNVSQVLMEANADRSGWFFQNNTTEEVWINELGGDAQANNGCIMVAPGESFPPAGYPVSLLAISILSPEVPGDGEDLPPFTAREW